MLVGGDQRHVLAHRLPNEIAQRVPIGGFDELADHIALASNGANDRDFPPADPRQASSLAAMTVLVFAADVGFINFDFPHQLLKASMLHRRTNAMAHIPGCPIVATSDLAMNLQGTNAFLALHHQIDDLEPRAQRIVCVLKDSFRNDRESVAVRATAILRFTDPVKGTRFQFIHLLTAACRLIDFRLAFICLLSCTPIESNAPPGTA